MELWSAGKGGRRMSPDWRGEDDEGEYPGIGRPRAEPPQVMTAKQIVYAFEAAASAAEREYAAAEAQSFLLAAGEDVGMEVLAVMLALPDTELTRPALDLVEERIEERLSAAVVPLLTAAAEPHGRRRENAAALLAALPASRVAAALIGVLAGEHEDGLKRGAAAELVALGRPVAGLVLDALADAGVRRWILEAAGCPADAGDAEIMRRLVGSSGG